MKPSIRTLAVLPAAAFALMGASAFAQDPAHPDISGIWTLTAPIATAKTEDGKTPPLNAKGKAIYDKNLASAKKGNRSFDGVTECLPPGLPYVQLIAKPFQILQKPKQVYFLYQENRIPRWVYVDQPHPAKDDIDPTYMGDASAKWEGDTLVIDTVGLNDKNVVDRSGLPHSADIHVIERVSIKGEILEDKLTIDDPAFYTSSWTTVAHYKRMPGNFHIPEEVCSTHFTQSSTVGAKKTAAAAPAAKAEKTEKK